MNQPDLTDEHFDSLSYVMTAAAPTGPALYQMFKKRAPNVILREGIFLLKYRYIVTLHGDNHGDNRCSQRKKHIHETYISKS